MDTISAIVALADWELEVSMAKHRVTRDYTKTFTSSDSTENGPSYFGQNHEHSTLVLGRD